MRSAGSKMQTVVSTAALRLTTPLAQLYQSAQHFLRTTAAHTAQRMWAALPETAREQIEAAPQQACKLGMRASLMLLGNVSDVMTEGIAEPDAHAAERPLSVATKAQLAAERIRAWLQAVNRLVKEAQALPDCERAFAVMKAAVARGDLHI